MPERSRNLKDKPKAKNWFDEHPDAKEQFDIAVNFLRTKYLGDNDGFVNIGEKKAAQYRFNNKQSGYVVVHGQVGAALVVFGKDRERFWVKQKKDLEAISYFLQKNATRYLGFKDDFEKVLKNMYGPYVGNYRNSSEKSPLLQQVTIFRHVRDKNVVNQRLILANGICGRCNKPAPFLRKKDGTPFLEVHHMFPLSRNGIDAVENTIALCPNCHRETHDELNMEFDDE